jgi:predicted secreted protein
MATKIIGTTLTKTSGTSLTVSGITSLGELGSESEEIETTNFDSTNGYREFVPGLMDGGDLSIEGIITKDSESDFEDMKDLADAQTNESWEVEFPDGAKWFLVAFVKTWKSASSEVDNVRRFMGSLRIVGKPVYASTGISA